MFLPWILVLTVIITVLISLAVTKRT